jgi:hypothetical protein
VFHNLPVGAGRKDFTRILAKLAGEQQWWTVDAVFDVMYQRRIHPDAHKFTAAINVFAKS